jgi:hypothetical protein
MQASIPSQERLRQALLTPTRGILGLVDDLLPVSAEHGIHLDWQAGNCRVQFLQEDLPSPIEIPLRISVFRAALARIAVLCNQRQASSVSPYGGQGELMTGSDAAAVIRAAFANTPDEQYLELLPVATDGAVDQTRQLSQDGNGGGEVRADRKTA